MSKREELVFLLVVGFDESDRLLHCEINGLAHSSTDRNDEFRTGEDHGGFTARDGVPETCSIQNSFRATVGVAEPMGTFASKNQAFI